MLRGLAHALLASVFIYGGADALRHPESKVSRAAAVTEPVARATRICADTTDLVRANGALQVGAGFGLASGVLTRSFAAVLSGSLVITTLAGHRFWEETDRAARTQQTIQFAKNLSMLGGLLAVVAAR